MKFTMCSEYSALSQINSTSLICALAFSALVANAGPVTNSGAIGLSSVLAQEANEKDSGKDQKDLARSSNSAVGTKPPEKNTNKSSSKSQKGSEIMARGNEALQRGDTKEAIRLFQEALNLLPGNAGLRQRLANALFREGEIDKAVAEMEMAVKLQPAQTVYQTELAWLYTKVNRVNAAMKHAKIARDQAPDTVSPYVLLGYCYASTDKDKLAEEALTKALEIDPENVTAMIYLAEVYASRGDSTKAIATYEKAILKDSDNLSVLLGLGGVYGEAGKAEQEKELYEKAIKLYPEDPEALGRYGWYLSTHGDMGGALTYGFKANSQRIGRSYDQFMGMFIAVWAGIFIVFGIIFSAIAFGAKFKPQSGEEVLRSFFLVIHKDRPGRLVLTSRRVVFVPELLSRSFGATRLSIERDQISNLQLNKSGGTCQLDIDTRSGTEHRFKIPVMIHEPLQEVLQKEGLLDKVSGATEAQSADTASSAHTGEEMDGSKSVSEGKNEASSEASSASSETGSDKVTAASYDFRPDEGKSEEEEGKEGSEDAGKESK